MQKYEVLAIIINSLDEKKAEEQAKKSISEHVQSLGGNITFEDFWGARGFAYILKKEKWGYYFCAQFGIAPNALFELKRDWNIDKSIVRFLVEKVHPSAPALRPYTEMKKEFDALEKERKIAEMDKAPKKKVVRTEKPKEEKKESPAPKEAARDEKAPKKKEPKATEAPKDIVDKKLDEILEDSSLDL